MTTSDPRSLLSRICEITRPDQDSADKMIDHIAQLIRDADAWRALPLPVLAMALAVRAHEGHTDKAGQPYSAHLARVVARVAGDTEAETVAWLHDVIEDCADTYATQLRSTFPQEIVTACELLARNTAPSVEEYYRRIRDNPLALKVKLADIADNADERRLAKLPAETAHRLSEKYAAARAALGTTTGQ